MTGPAIHRYFEVSSTLDVLHELAGRGAPHGTVVVAGEQREGRGTRGRTWYSPPGGLWYSILYRRVAESALEQLSLRIGLGAVRAVESVAGGVRLGLKWPNDLMLGERKLGGILGEARWQGARLAWVVVGIGINVQNPVPTDMASTAVSLADQVPGLAPGDLVLPLTTMLREISQERVGLDAGELAEFRGRDWLMGRRLTEPVPGIARGIRPDGALLVEQADGSTLPVRAGQPGLASPA